MSGETVKFEQAETSAQSGKREQSTIAFPYHDLDAAAEVAAAVYRRSGLGSCDLDELAAEMGQVIGGAFRVKLGAARTFDLLDKDGRGAVKLTELGRRIVTDERAPTAKVDAFLSVPLYSAIFEKYKGQKLPPPKALEREMAALGVSGKQTDKARQAFERAARQAGFFDASPDRLVRPRIEAGAEKPITSDESPEAPKTGGGNNGDGGDRRITDKALEYKLVDLMKDSDIGDDERAAIWTLIQFLTKRAKTNGDLE